MILRNRLCVGLALVFWLATSVAIGAFPSGAAKMPAVTPGVAAFGELLFTKWALPFEIASVVLLVALVGAVWWGGGDDGR